MDSMRAARSPCGVVAGMVVGDWWVVGYTALRGGLVIWFSATGAGRAKGYSASSISVSLTGSGLVYCVRLVSTGMFKRSAHSRAKR
jgi:hypothetical protein